MMHAGERFTCSCIHVRRKKGKLCLEKPGAKMRMSYNDKEKNYECRKYSIWLRVDEKREKGKVVRFQKTEWPTKLSFSSCDECVMILAFIPEIPDS